MGSVLEDFGVSGKLNLEVLQAVWGDQATDSDLVSSPVASLQKWLPLLPAPISQQITLALNQERPFLPPDVTPEMMAEHNETMPSMNHMEIIYCCIDFAMQAKDYPVAAALIYVVDRACYRFGKSSALLRLVDAISQASPHTAIAPQVILRQARVMKDSGDLHTAMRILNAVITRERRWDYKNEEQYENTKAVCVQIKGQILHNLGLWKEAVPPLVESVHSFHFVGDAKGKSSSLALLSRCLKKLEPEDYRELQGRFYGAFVTDHPFYEAYQKGVEAARLIENLGATVYLAHNQMVADESLLMFTIQHRHMTHRQKLDQYQTIVEELKRSLANHRTVRYMSSLEVYLAFVRAIFIISLTLHFSPIPQDTHLSRFLERLSLELYAFVSRQTAHLSGEATSTTLSQNLYSVRRMNGALALLGLSTLEGSAEVEEKEAPKKWSEAGKCTGASSSESGGSTSLDHTDSSQQTEESDQAASVPALQVDNTKKEGGNVDLNALKSKTFPSANPSKFHHHGKPVSTKQKFVGLTMSKEDLRSATCPGFVAKESGADDVDAPVPPQQPVDLDCLVVSADSIASATAAGVDLHSSSSMCPSSSSSASNPTPSSAGSSESSSFVVVGSSSSSSTAPTSSSTSSQSSKAKSSSSDIVDQSASTRSTSSATDDSWEITSGLSSSLGVTSSSSSQSSSKSGSKSASVVPPQNSTGLKSSSLSQNTNSSATVDQLADTEPSSSSYDSTDFSGDGSSGLSPLVDVSSSSACALMAGLELGSSVETSDSGEFLERFVPSDSGDVHRAVLMNYNPLTGLWSAQTTLAYQGPQLNTATKGTHRDVFHVSFLHQDEPLGRYVGKRYRRGRRAPEVYMQDVVCQMLAGYYVTRFNQSLQNCPLDILQVQFLSAAHLQLLTAEGQVFDWMNVEPFLQGSFLKLTNNLRFVSTARKDERGVEVATALSHFSWVETRGALMMVDMQGWMPADGKGVVFLTDPVFHTRNMKQFSSGDRHLEGMAAFWANQHPRCNRICQFLGLDGTRPDNGGGAIA